MEVYLDQAKLLFTEPKHAWAFVSLLYLIAAFVIQLLLSSSVRKSAKRISSKNMKALNQKYLGRSLSGWFFFLAAWITFILYWYAQYFQIAQIPDYPVSYLAASIVSFLLSLVFHLAAYAASALDQIKALEDKQLTP